LLEADHSLRRRISQGRGRDQLAIVLRAHARTDEQDVAALRRGDERNLRTICDVDHRIVGVGCDEHDARRVDHVALGQCLLGATGEQDEDGGGSQKHVTLSVTFG
jgi:hypothetical protein